MKVEIKDEFGLDKSLLQFLEDEARGLDFDSLRYADEIKVYVSKHTPCQGETWKPEIDVLFEWSSSEDDRGNGYFGYDTTLKLLREDMENLN